MSLFIALAERVPELKLYRRETWRWEFRGYHSDMYCKGFDSLDDAVAHFVETYVKETDREIGKRWQTTQKE